jgi:hypothetical protein
LKPNKILNVLFPSGILKIIIFAFFSVLFGLEPAFSRNGKIVKIPDRACNFEDSVFHKIPLKSVIPYDDTTSARVAYVKKWPYRKNCYIAIVREEIDSEAYSGYYLAMFEYLKPDKSPTFVARYNGVLPMVTSWDTTAEDWSAKWLPDEKPFFISFDFAPYKISDTETAFALRFSEGGRLPGGNQLFPDLLMLFDEKDTVISNLLSVPISFVKNGDGNFQDDENSSKDAVEVNCIVVMLKTKTHDHYDLMLKSSDGRWKKTFTWSSENGKYVP